MENRNIDDKGVSFLQGFALNYQGEVDQIRLHLEQLKNYIELDISQNTRSGNDQYLGDLKTRWLEVEELGHQVTSNLALLNVESGFSYCNPSRVIVSDVFKNINKQFYLRSQSTTDIKWSCVPVGNVDKEVYIDQKLISAAIVNVINRAYKNTVKGGVKTTFRVDGGEIVVDVHDSGNGLMGKETDIFSSKATRSLNTLELGESNIKECYSGVNDLLQVAGGSITISSSIGLGTKVVLRFPFEDKPNDLKYNFDVPSPVREVNKKGDSLNYLNATYIKNRVEDGLKVLVVDSDLHNIQRVETLLSKQMLRRNDIQVTVCQDLSGAICEIEETSYDLLLIGYCLPGISGFDFLKYIDTSENECKGAVKVIMNADLNFNECINSKVLSLSDITVTNGASTKDVRDIVRRLTVRLV